MRVFSGRTISRSDRLDAFAYELEQLANRRRPPAEMMIEIQGTTRVRLIAVGERTATLATYPERAGFTRLRPA